MTSLPAPRAPAAVAVALFVAICAVYLVLVLKFPLGYIYATYENLYGEWLQVAQFAIAMVVSFALVRRAGHPHRAFFGVLGLACFYVVGEEISWGQQVFDWDSPDWFKEKNLQGETNLHNMVTGPYSTALKDVIEYTLAGGLIGYGLIAPVLLRVGWGLAHRVERLGLAIPPLYLWPFWTLGAAFEVGYFSFNEAEVAEVLISFALAALALHHLVVARRGGEPHAPATWGAGTGGALARGLAVAFAVALVGAVGATQAMLSNPESARRADKRIGAGIEKFAERYANRKNYAVANELFGMALEREPENRAHLRRYARTLRLLDRDDEALEVLNRTLELDKAKLRGKPKSASAHRSLVRTYRLLDEDDTAQRHLDAALRISRQRVKEHPRSPNAHYSLGRALELSGEKKEAKASFKIAQKLAPGTKKFRRAVHRVGKGVDSG